MDPIFEGKQFLLHFVLSRSWLPLLLLLLRMCVFPPFFGRNRGCCCGCCGCGFCYRSAVVVPVVVLSGGGGGGGGKCCGVHCCCYCCYYCSFSTNHSTDPRCCWGTATVSFVVCCRRRSAVLACCTVCRSESLCLVAFINSSVLLLVTCDYWKKNHLYALPNSGPKRY